MELFFELGFETICSSILFAKDLFARKFVVVFIFTFNAQNVDRDAYNLIASFSISRLIEHESIQSRILSIGRLIDFYFDITDRGKLAFIRELVSIVLSVIKLADPRSDIDCAFRIVKRDYSISNDILLRERLLCASLSASGRTNSSVSQFKATFSRSSLLNYYGRVKPLSFHHSRRSWDSISRVAGNEIYSRSRSLLREIIFYRSISSIYKIFKYFFFFICVLKFVFYIMI